MAGYGTILRMHDFDWGDVPTWITAFATVIALAAAVLAVRASWEVLKVERQREDRTVKAEDERRQREERAEQADLVAVWSVPASARTVIHNGSQLPIYRVVVTYVFPSVGESREAGLLVAVPPGTKEAPVPALPDVMVDPYSGEPVTIGMDVTGARHEVRFVDTGGRHWHRNIDGVLTLTGRDEP